MNYDYIEDAPCTTLPRSMLNFLTSVLEIVIEYNLSFGVVRNELRQSTEEVDAFVERLARQGACEMWDAFGCSFGHNKQHWLSDEKYESVWFDNREEFREELRARHIGVSYHMLYSRILKVLRKLAAESVFAPLMGAFAARVN